MNKQTEPTEASAKHSTETRPVAYRDELFLFEVGNMAAHFNRLRNRRHARRRRYSLVLRLLLLSLGKLAGHDKPEAIADWARLHATGRVELLKLKRGGIPHVHCAFVGRVNRLCMSRILVIQSIANDGSNGLNIFHPSGDGGPLWAT